jgi:hypothetical protein
MNTQAFVAHMVGKARAMNWLCIWPRTSHPNSKASARATRSHYMNLARMAKAGLK